MDWTVSRYVFLTIFIKKNFLGSSKEINFEFGEGTVAHNGCGATLFGQFWYFGGGSGSADSSNPYKKQVNSLINGLDLTDKMMSHKLYVT